MIRSKCGRWSKFYARTRFCGMVWSPQRIGNPLIYWHLGRSRLRLKWWEGERKCLLWKNGTPAWGRTRDQRFRKPLLYPLSYGCKRLWRPISYQGPPHLASHPRHSATPSPLSRRRFTLSCPFLSQPGPYSQPPQTCAPRLTPSPPRLSCIGAAARLYRVLPGPRKRAQCGLKPNVRFPFSQNRGMASALWDLRNHAMGARLPSAR